jgi:hypothetical protein
MKIFPAALRPVRRLQPNQLSNRNRKVNLIPFVPRAPNGGFVESDTTRIRNIGSTDQDSGVLVTVESVGGDKLGYVSVGKGLPAKIGKIDEQGRKIEEQQVMIAGLKSTVTRQEIVIA